MLTRWRAVYKPHTGEHFEVYSKLRLLDQLSIIVGGEMLSCFFNEFTEAKNCSSLLT